MNTMKGTANATKADCPDCRKDQPAQQSAEAVNLTERELLIYQAGQAFGAAQALRQVAEQVNKLSQTINGQANTQAAAGQELLNRALASGNKQTSGLKQRAAKVLSALVDPAE